MKRSTLDRTTILKESNLIIPLDEIYPDSTLDYILDYFELQYVQKYRFFEPIDKNRWTRKFTHDKMEALERACWVIYNQKNTNLTVLNFTNIHVKTKIDLTEIGCNLINVKDAV